MLLGITGGVATGKSTVATLFRQRGAVVFSADEAAREVVRPGSPALRQIAESFGAEYVLPDGSLDRGALGGKVFEDSKARARLEAITHPAILRRLKEQIAEAQAREPNRLVAVEAPLLYEAGMEGWFDRVIVVACSPETQLHRLIARTGLSEEEAAQRIAAQMPLEYKVRRGHVTLWNDGTPEELDRQVEELWERLQ